jgi:aldehyde dehydrogenase (NAD+)
MAAIQMDQVLKVLGISDIESGVSCGKELMNAGGELIVSHSPVDGKVIGKVTAASVQDYETVIRRASDAYKVWRNVPAPKRGEIVRQFGDELRTVKAELGALVSYEMGKSYQEGLGEVQEMIDICDFAVGLSRQLYGLTMHSERPSHRMYEQWHPLGIVGIISAFNFPVAVWSWNTALAWVCGDVCVWKPSEKTPLCAVACQKIITRVLQRNNVPDGVSCLVVGDYKIGELLSADNRVPLISATGSTRMGRKVGEAVARRLGRSLLELGGNNAIVVSAHANLELALKGIVFGAVGTAGQRCTTTRRVFVHESIYDSFLAKLVSAYKQLRIGNPLDENNHVGPLIDTLAVDHYLKAINSVRSEGGSILVEGGVISGEGYESGCYVRPCIIEASNKMNMVMEETFAPILYVMKYSTLEEAVFEQNDVPQGLSSALFTNHLQEAEFFLSCNGSDCGIANVNIGTSGAEIGGAFGGEKETGGGRESGSDAWKVYMRRQTNTINYGSVVPLAQGIKFDV